MAQIILSVLVILGSSLAWSKSSDIPERREFPLNDKINPCENFYDYVCSNVINSFELREDRSAHTFSFSDSTERLLEKKKNYFKGLAKVKANNHREESLKNFYLSCMDEKSRIQEEKQTINAYKASFAKLKTRDDVWSWIEKSYVDSEESPLNWGATENMDDPSHNDLYFVSNYKTLPEKSYYKKEEVMKDFRALLVAFFKTIQAKDPEVQAQNVLEYEYGLAEVTPAPAEFRKLVNDRKFITRDELAKKYPALHLKEVFSHVPETAVIRNWIPESLEYIAGYLVTAPLDKIKSVLLFHSLYNFIDDSHPEFYQVRFDFNKKHFGGPNVRPDRQERCTRRAMQVFNKEIDSILLPQVFPNFDKDKFIAFAEKIRGSILLSLKNNNWLSDEARKEAIHKIESAKLQLVSPNNEKEWDFLPEADYDAKKFIKNEKTVSAMLLKKTLKEFVEPNDPNIWHMGPLTVNAYYTESYNKFVMPIGILQYPFYDAKLPIEENLAAVGSVIGHELGHGIDDQGSRYDALGKQRVWMTEKDLAGFSKRTETLVEQFEKAGHNGKLTLGENIGDLVGVTASRQAADQEPGFAKDRERQKAYYAAYARLWCEVKRPKFIENQLKVDPHSLGLARANEQMKQQPGFREAFQCRDKDSMVLPKDKLVHIW